MNASILILSKALETAGRLGYTVRHVRGSGKRAGAAAGGRRPHRGSSSASRHIGPYRVDGRLGRGGMGEVLRGYDERLDRPVALKRLLPGGPDPEHARQRFRREARVAARLSDSAIVQVYDWVEAEGGDWLVMELVEGRTLAEVLGDGLPERAQALRIAREVASGLAAAHDLGLVHRDLKPANVMLIAGEGSAPDRIKILDFGVAKPLGMTGGAPFSTLTADGHVVGTVTAMSPEQALGQPVDHVDRLLAKEPARRPADAREVVAELERLSAAPATEPESSASPVADRTTIVAEALPSPAEPSPRRKSRALLLVGAGGLLIAGLWSASVWWGPWGEQGPDAGAPPPASSEAGLDSHDLFQHGMALLERYDKKGNIDEAVADFQRALALDEESAPALAGLARAYWLDSFFGSLDAWLGQIYTKTGRLQEAETAFRRSLEIAPDNFLSYRNLGGALYMQGDMAGAASQFQQALQIQPDPSLYANLGTIYFVQGLYPRAVSAFEKAIESGGSNNYVVWANLGDAYRWTPDNETPARDAFQRAIQLLRKRLEATPGDLGLRTRLALYLAKLGDCDLTVAEIDTHAEMPDQEARAWFRLATANEICGRRDTALADLETALHAGFPITEVETDPELLELRRDVRYHRLVMGL